MKTSSATSLRHFKSAESGAGIFEFALSLPLLLLLVFGVLEVTRFVQANQKATQVAYATADLITQNLSLSDEDVNALLGSAELMMRPFPADESNLTLVVTSIAMTLPDPAITQWQRSWPEGRESQSLISGGEGQVVDIPAFQFIDRDQVVVVEVFYNYRSLLGLPITDPFINTEEGLYKVAFTRPRYGSLMQPAQESSLLYPTFTGGKPCLLCA